MMQSTFHSGFTDTVLLFKEWKISTFGEFLLSLLFIISITICAEGCRAYQTFLAYSLSVRRVNNESRNVTLTRRTRIYRHLLATVVYVFQLTFAYVIMLCVMTYQVYILVVVLIGVGLGYYLSQPVILKGMGTLYIKVSNQHEELAGEESEKVFLTENNEDISLQPL